MFDHFHDNQVDKHTHMILNKDYGTPNTLGVLKFLPGELLQSANRWHP